MDFSFRRFRELEAIKSGQHIPQTRVKRKTTKNKDNDLQILEFPPDNQYLTRIITQEEAIAGEKEILQDEINKLKKEIGFLRQSERAAEARNKREEKINEDFDRKYKEEQRRQPKERQMSEMEKRGKLYTYSRRVLS